MVLKEYWPRYLQELIEFQQIANAEQPEFENAVSDVKSAADDFFLVSLSEYGCERWEKILGLSAAPGDTVQDRRDRILIKYLDHGSNVVAITGATVSTKGVTTGVNAALAVDAVMG